MQVHWADAEEAGRDERTVPAARDASLLRREGHKKSGERHSPI